MSFKRKEDFSDPALSVALIDQVLPAEIIHQILIYDLPTALAAREVSTYWRSFLDSDVEFTKLVRQQMKLSKKLWKQALESNGFRFEAEPEQTSTTDDDEIRKINENHYYDSERKKWRLKKSDLTKDLIKNVCAAEKRGKHLVLVPCNVVLSIPPNTKGFERFIVQTSGTIAGIPQKAEFHIILGQRQRAIKPANIALPKNENSSVELAFSLQDLWTAKYSFYKRERLYKLNFYYAHVTRPLAWTFGIFPNSAEMLWILCTLLLVPGLFSLFIAKVPALSFHSTLFYSTIVFLWASNKSQRSIFARDLAVWLWFLVPIIGNHWISGGTSRVVYDALANTIWSVVSLIYVVLAENYIFEDKKLAHYPNKRIATFIAVVLFFIGSLNVSKVFAAILNLEILAKLAYNVVLLFGSALHHGLGAAAVLLLGVTFDTMLTELKKLLVRPVLIKAGIAIVIRMLLQYS